MERPLVWIVLGLVIVGRTAGGLSPEGVMCGGNRCSTVEYCNRYVEHCKPCSSICDVDSSNYQPVECLSDCQEYLHDKRYVLLKQYEDLRGEVRRLWIFVAIAIAVGLVSLLTTLYLLTTRFAKWKKLRGAFRRAFTGNWIKTTRNGNDNNNHSNNNNINNNNNKKNNRAQDDPEMGTSRQNGLRLAMPTISASVAPSRVVGNANANGSGNGSGSGIGIDNGTPNTTSTSLSGRHPSEDTTLDYAYDNPAMTPSPESVQIRTNRESSF